MDKSTIPKLTRVTRLDRYDIKACYTPEGFLMDEPVLTRTGIFEYTNPDGSIRRELRRPEDVFAKESLASYLAKPVIITHDAGLITKDNVADEQIGTIISEGFRDGDNVRAKIVIHDTDSMKKCGFKELSLGYNLDLDETPGVWNGQHYDAVQTNITINHLALVREARAGEKARLNIDSRDAKQGGKQVMDTKKKGLVRSDGILTPEELEEAIKEYTAKHTNAETPANEGPSEAPVKKDADTEAPAEKTVPRKENDPAMTEDGDDECKKEEPASIEDTIATIKENRDRRDADGEPEDMEAAKATIERQDEDTQKLLDIIDTLLAQKDFGQKTDGCGKECEGGEFDGEGEMTPESKKAFKKSFGSCDAEGEEGMLDPDEEKNTDSEEENLPKANNGEDPALGDRDPNLDFEDNELVGELDTTVKGGKTETKKIDGCGRRRDAETGEFLPDDEEGMDGCEEKEEDIPLEVKKLNADSIDRLVSAKTKIGMMGRKVNLDGLERLPYRKAVVKLIKAVRPSVRLDGKSDRYLAEMCRMAFDEINSASRFDTRDQKRQMFNKDSRTDGATHVAKGGAEEARARMIARHNKEEK